MFEFHFLKVSRLGVANQESYTWPSSRFRGPEISKSWNFPKYWRWWRVQASKITKFARWRDFNALRRAHVSFTWLVGWLHPKSNSVYRGDCSTKGGRTIRTFPNFDLNFRDQALCILKTFEDHCVRRCLNFIFWKYHGWALRNEKVIRCQASGSMRSFLLKILKFPKTWSPSACAVWGCEALLSNQTKLSRRKLILKQNKIRNFNTFFKFCSRNGSEIGALPRVSDNQARN